MTKVNLLVPSRSYIGQQGYKKARCLGPGESKKHLLLSKDRMSHTMHIPHGPDLLPVESLQQNPPTAASRRRWCMRPHECAAICGHPLSFACNPERNLWRKVG